MTIDQLKEFGADTAEGLNRCMNNEAFYLKMVGMGLADKRFDELKTALESKDYDEAFEIVHALKGVLGNLALTPLYDLICDMTEDLRARTDKDYMPLYNEIKEKRDKLVALG
ncbi:MAG: Hpt domain-containing protein [Lachnospiraceae bacterium]|nr:Hpt domain-containing protein [Lachnospiraceae bacterium]